MLFLNGVAERRVQPEIMDQPGLETDRHQAALRGLERINWWSGSVGILWKPIRELARELNGKPVRVLDLATGAGDLPIRLWHKARRAGFKLSLAGCDRNQMAVEFAQRRAVQKKADVRFFAWDALHDALPSDFDVLTCSLFLHHLDAKQAVALLERMAAAARRLVLVNDLVRSRLGLTLAEVATRVLTSSPVVRTDGPRSVEAAFTIKEARGLARQAGIGNATVERRWPCRFLLSWRRME